VVYEAANRAKKAIVLQKYKHCYWRRTLQLPGKVLPKSQRNTGEPKPLTEFQDRKNNKNNTRNEEHSH